MYAKKVLFTLSLFIASILLTNNVNAQCNISSTGYTNPTTCSGTNGSIFLNGLANSTTYTINYKLNGTSVTPVSKTSSASGTITIGSLAAGSYTNIIVSKTGCTSTAQGPFTLTDPATPVITASNKGPLC